jgi:ribosomal RNA-processing protein 36
MRQYQPESDSDSGGAPEEFVKGRKIVTGRKIVPNNPSDDEGPSSSGRSHSSSEAADSDAGSDDLDLQEQALEQRLAEVPLEAVTKQLKDGKGPTGAAARAAAFAANKQVFHRETKNRPQQLSSKKPVSRFREVIQVPKQ